MPRLVMIGLSSLLPGADGLRPVDTPAFPAEFKPFSLAHAAGLDVLRAEGGAQDWVCISPAGDFEHGDATRTGGYTVHEHAQATARISYPDFAIALLDEAEVAHHRHTRIAVS